MDTSTHAINWALFISRDHRRPQHSFASALDKPQRDGPEFSHPTFSFTPDFGVMQPLFLAVAAPTATLQHCDQATAMKD
jgi:hypothetical protein